jgi:HK97 family phage portal protein
MRCATVFACVRVLSESIASLPIHLYKRKDDGGRTRAEDHPAYKLMHTEPHPDITACQYIETVVMHLALTGNHYSLLTPRNDGSVGSLTPLNPRNVKVEYTSAGSLRYVYTENGKPIVYDAAQILHIPGLAWDGIVGMSPIAYARESIGLALAAEEFGARFFGSGTNVGTVFTVPAGVRMSQEQSDKLLEDLRAKHAGLGSAHSGMILPNGMTATRVGVPPSDAQFLESRKFQKAEIASIFRVPLVMIQEHEGSTTWGSGIESMTIGFVVYTLRPWMVRIEQALNRKLLSGEDRDNYYFEFLTAALLRGDQAARANYYMQAIQNQWMTPNEVRQLENMDPADWGDEPVRPANIYGGASNEEKPPENQFEETKAACDCGHEHRYETRAKVDHPRMSIQRSYRRVIADALARVIRRERNDVIAGVKKSLRRTSGGWERRSAEVEQFITEFYESHHGFVVEAIRPAFTSLAEAVGSQAMREIGREWSWNNELEDWLERFIDTFANSHTGRSRGQLLAILSELAEDGDIVTALTGRFDEWESGSDENDRPRSDRAADYESVRLGGGFARAAFFAAGIASLVWVSTGSETCPYCESLNGRSVGREDVFLTAGQAFNPSGASSPLVPGLDIGHPPAHAGCDCILIPGG